MILLEGADGTGKSTLATALSRELKWRVYHFGAPTRPYLEEWLHFLVYQQTNHLILDRFHLGDLVYGPTWRGKTMNKQEFMAIELALQVRGTTLVHVYTTTQQAAGVIEVRGDDLVASEDVGLHLEAFKIVVEQSILPLVHWSHEFHASQGAGSILPMKEILQRHEVADRYRTAFPTMPGIGSLQPEWILVGERPNQNKLKLALEVPFAVGTAGEWLILALEELGLLGRVYITNAVKADGDRNTSSQEIRWLQNQSEAKVVALGETASALLQQHKIAHRLAQHPAYSRRFHFKKNYAVHLSEAMA